LPLSLHEVTGHEDPTSPATPPPPSPSSSTS
jgi:hypothetical protein